MTTPKPTIADTNEATTPPTKRGRTRNPDPLVRFFCQLISTVIWFCFKLSNCNDCNKRSRGKGRTKRTQRQSTILGASTVSTLDSATEKHIDQASDGSKGLCFDKPSGDEDDVSADAAPSAKEDDSAEADTTVKKHKTADANAILQDGTSVTEEETEDDSVTVQEDATVVPSTIELHWEDEEEHQRNRFTPRTRLTPNHPPVGTAFPDEYFFNQDDYATKVNRLLEHVVFREMYGFDFGGVGLVLRYKKEYLRHFLRQHHSHLHVEYIFFCIHRCNKCARELRHEGVTICNLMKEAKCFEDAFKGLTGCTQRLIYQPQDEALRAVKEVSELREQVKKLSGMKKQVIGTKAAQERLRQHLREAQLALDEMGSSA